VGTSKEQVDCVKAWLKIAFDKHLLQVKTGRMSQNGFETHLGLDEEEEDKNHEEEEEEEESIYMSAKTSKKTVPSAFTNNSHTNQSNLFLDSYENDDYGSRDNNNGITSEEDILSLSNDWDQPGELILYLNKKDNDCMRRLSYGTECGENILSYGATNLANGSTKSLDSRSERRNTSIVNHHSMQTDTFRGGNISVQIEVMQRRSIGTEVFL
jgi:hypothetical protein